MPEAPSPFPAVAAALSDALVLRHDAPACQCTPAPDARLERRDMRESIKRDHPRSMPTAVIEAAMHALDEDAPPHAPHLKPRSRATCSRIGTGRRHPVRVPGRPGSNIEPGRRHARLTRSLLPIIGTGPRIDCVIDTRAAALGEAAHPDPSSAPPFPPATPQ